MPSPWCVYSQAYADTSIIPESQVQLLGPASRVATTDDINKWTITEIDTLAFLMDTSEGNEDWDPSMVSKPVNKGVYSMSVFNSVVFMDEYSSCRLKQLSQSIWAKKETHWALLSSTPSEGCTCAHWTLTCWGISQSRALGERDQGLEDVYIDIMIHVSSCCFCEFITYTSLCGCSDLKLLRCFYDACCCGDFNLTSFFFVMEDWRKFKTHNSCIFTALPPHSVTFQSQH